MPDITTHLYFINSSRQKNKNLFSDLNKTWLKYGAMYPDIYYFIPFKIHKFLGKNLSDFWHGDNDDNQIGLRFGRDLIKYSRTKKELSFAIGFYSHFVLDVRGHGYLRRKKELHNINHLIIEHFLDSNYNQKVPLLKLPRRLLIEVFTKEHPKFYKAYINQLNLTYFTPLLYTIYVYVNHFIITRKYRAKWTTENLSVWDIFFWGAYYKPIKRIGFKGLNKLVYPDYELKKKHVKNLKEEIEIARKLLITDLKKYKKKSEYYSFLEQHTD